MTKFLTALAFALATTAFAAGARADDATNAMKPANAMATDAMSTQAMKPATDAMKPATDAMKPVTDAMKPVDAMAPAQ
ncbi:hypothetical protein RFN25_02530 [Mesorhizobium abyssinicae]|uniref:hypothetical protein n=1 Tax=Mesorhizobium abyssinicae TaxID=1209958 RepID=UPI002A244E59|nr:hypothetical protein [Mesorhizobium abyssinicae]MDX8432305.1 hypothetical protein [Mesorhizobium abyssinicae]